MKKTTARVETAAQPIIEAAFKKIAPEVAESIRFHFSRDEVMVTFVTRTERTRRAVALAVLMMAFKAQGWALETGQAEGVWFVAPDNVFKVVRKPKEEAPAVVAVESDEEAPALFSATLEVRVPAFSN
ncbi:hypothetical protein [Kitasatospora griseola]|uniref:hypothetical protein n=1 Tax=Kitasatospora griseola TaxID=2064 RepID=UPI00343C32B3